MKKLMHIGVGAALAVLLASAPTQAQTCTGDCDGSVEVTVNEIISMVNIALGSAAVSTCTAGDGNGDGEITINEIIGAVNNALANCPVVGPTPTVTPGTGTPTCGDGAVAGTETCDDGGVCIGGSNAGTACMSEATCLGNGVCTDGVKVGTSCDADGDCPDGTCRKCRPQGGDGCAANCTGETVIPTSLVPGMVVGLDIAPNTSGAVVHGDVLTIPLALVGSQEVTVGKKRSDDPQGRIPYIIKAATVNFPKIAVSTLACACVRGVELKTCGGTLFDADGQTTPSCTEGFSNTTTCAVDKPCTRVHGLGNSATGFIGCSASGLSGVDVSLSQDAGGETGTPGPVLIELSGTGPQGSAVVLNSTAIGTHVGGCPAPPATFCGPLESDPIGERGTPSTLPATTSSATAIVTNANGVDDLSIVDPVTGEQYRATGRPANCANLEAATPNLSGFATAGAFPSLGLAVVGDIVVTNNFVNQ